MVDHGFSASLIGRGIISKGQAMNLPQEAYQIIVDLHARNLDLARGSDSDRRALTLMMAQTLCARLGPRWGTKAQSPTHPQSKDAIAFYKGILGVTTWGEPMDVWDWQNGYDKSVQVRPNSHPSYPDVTGQFFIQVEPIDHLFSDPVPDPPAPVEGEPQWEKLEKLLLKEIEESKARQEAMRVQIEVTRTQVIGLLSHIRSKQDLGMVGEVNMGWLGKHKIVLIPRDE